MIHKPFHYKLCTAVAGTTYVRISVCGLCSALLQLHPALGVCCDGRSTELYAMCNHVYVSFLPTLPSPVQVISCYENGLPYSLDPYTLNTLGPDDLGGRIKLGCCGAHFRLDTKKNVSVHVTVIAHDMIRQASMRVYWVG